MLNLKQLFCKHDYPQNTLKCSKCGKVRKDTTKNINKNKTKSQLLKEIDILKNSTECLQTLNMQLSNRLTSQRISYEQEISKLKQIIEGLHKQEYISNKDKIAIEDLPKGEGYIITYGLIRIFIDNVDSGVSIDMFNYANNCYEVIEAERYSYNIEKMLDCIENKIYINEQQKNDLLTAIKQHNIKTIKTYK